MSGSSPLIFAHGLMGSIELNRSFGENVDAIAETRTTLGDDGAESKPIEPQVIKTITVKP